MEFSTYLNTIRCLGHREGVGCHTANVGGSITLNVNKAAHSGVAGLQTRSLSRTAIDGLLGFDIAFLGIEAISRSDSDSHRLTWIGGSLVDSDSAIGNAALHSNRTGIDL